VIEFLTLESIQPRKLISDGHSLGEIYPFI